MEKRVVKKLGMLLRVLNSKKFKTARRGKKLEKVEGNIRKRIAETTPLIDGKIRELEKAQQEIAALNDLKDLCANLGDYSKDNITARVENLMQFFGISTDGPRRKKKPAAEKAEPAPAAKGGKKAEAAPAKAAKAPAKAAPAPAAE